MPGSQAEDLCVCMRADRYFGSFPKVGIVIPNPAQWLLPELQDIGRTLQTTLQLPPDATIGHGFTLQPTSDGLLINLPDGGKPVVLSIGLRRKKALYSRDSVLPCDERNAK